MTVCIATDNFYTSVGGIATFYKHLTTLLKSSGHQVVVLTINYQADYDEIKEKDGIVTIFLGKSYQEFYRHYKKFFSAPGYDAPNWIAMGMAMRKWLRENAECMKIDVIETIDYGGIGMFLKWQGGPPVCISGHGCLSQLVNYNHAIADDHVMCIKEMEREAFQHADAVITHSSMNQQQLKSWLQKDIDFCTAPWHTLKDDKAIKETSGHFLVVSGLQKTKGAIVTAEAIQMLQEQNHELEVRWIGGDTYTAEGNLSMKNYLAKRFPSIWNKSLVWINQKLPQEVKEEMTLAKAVLIPSEWETFSYIALEAAMLSKPIIITENAGAVYIFKNGYDALIIPSNKPEALAQAMLFLHNNPEQCDKLGKNAMMTILQAFDDKKIIEERMAVYKRSITNASQAIPDEHKVLKSFLSPARKYFYAIKAVAKKIIKGD